MEKQKKGKTASTSDKSYHKSLPKSSGKSKKSRKESAKKTAEKRARRRESALNALPIDQVLAKLDLVQDGSVVCPFCGGKDCLELDGEKNEFRCESCKQKGNAIRLVKKARGLTDWKAIAYLEKLSIAAKTSLKPIAAKTPAKSTDPENPTKPKQTPKRTAAKPKSPCRVSEEDLERIKREISVADLARTQGVILKRQGSDLVGLCPFHHDKKTPSLVITPEKNLWHCFGACDQGGSVIDWVMKAQGVGFLDALKLLREKHPLLNTGVSPTNKPSVTKPVLSVELSADEQTLLRQVIDYYHATLKNTPQAIAYLEKRGIKDYELVDAFKIGFADRTLGLRLPHKSCREGKEIREKLQRIGILRASSGHEHFNGSLVFPIIDENGIITEIYGRKINDNLRKGTPIHMYLPGPHKGVFNPHGFSAKRVILCESIIDAATWWSNRFRNVTASYGANGISDELIDRLASCGVDAVYQSQDGDDAGEKAADKAAKKLAQKGIKSFRLPLPWGMDVNEFALQNGRESLTKLIRSARPMGNGKSLSSVPAKLPSLAAKKTATKKTDETPENQPIPLAVKKTAVKQENMPGVYPAQSVVLADVKKETAKEKNIEGRHAPARVRGDEVELTRVDRVYRMRGMKKNSSLDSMRVTLRAVRANRIYIDTLDLYNARQRQPFIQAAAAELEVSPEAVRADLTELLLEVEQIQERRLEQTLKPKQEQVVLSDQERCVAGAFLSSPDLVKRILRDFVRRGLVGEQENALIMYLAMTSRLMDDPLAMIIQSLSAAGKTALMNFALDLMPPEKVVKYTGISGQSLFYMGENDLKHKILAISEVEGAQRASYPLKIMQSEGELCMASAGKDPKSGRFVTHEYRVEGPAAIISGTTAMEMDEELANRCLLLTADEEREQTRAIQNRQRERETIEGIIIERERKRIRKLHQNAQRLLRPLVVVNPYAKYLSFLDTRVRYRRDQPKYLTLIRAVALLHQFQRKIGRRKLPSGEIIEYIEVTLDDIALANRLFAHAMGACLSELPVQTKKLLMLIHRMVSKRCETEKIEQPKCPFTRREVREFTGWHDTQLKLHLDRLVDMEYLLARYGQNGRRYVYELLYDGQGQDGKRFTLGLLDVEELRKKLSQNQHYDENLSG